ncbi:hypothetical protein MNV49_007456 [Pseudohyphozyma bogoriensis]|nr:hypothetical protein MNV49_007456 [Pseudohyphozyma bogoriensis]
MVGSSPSKAAKQAGVSQRKALLDGLSWSSDSSSSSRHSPPKKKPKQTARKNTKPTTSSELSTTSRQASDARPPTQNDTASVTFHRDHLMPNFASPSSFARPQHPNKPSTSASKPKHLTKPKPRKKKTATPLYLSSSDDDEISDPSSDEDEPTLPSMDGIKKADAFNLDRVEEALKEYMDYLEREEPRERRREAAIKAKKAKANRNRKTSTSGRPSTKQLAVQPKPKVAQPGSFANPSRSKGLPSTAFATSSSQHRKPPAPNDGFVVPPLGHSFWNDVCDLTATRIQRRSNGHELLAKHLRSGDNPSQGYGEGNDADYEGPEEDFSNESGGGWPVRLSESTL